VLTAKSWALGDCAVLLMLTAVTTGCSVVFAARRSEDLKKLELGMTSAEVAQRVGEPQEKEDVTAPDGPVQVWSYIVYEGGYWDWHSIGFKDGRLASLAVPDSEDFKKPAREQTVTSTASKPAAETPANEQTAKKATTEPVAEAPAPEQTVTSTATKPVAETPANEQTAKKAAAEPVAEAQPETLGLEDLHRAYVTAYARGYHKGQQDCDAAWAAAIARLVPEDERAAKEREARAFVVGYETGLGEDHVKRETQLGWEEYFAAQGTRHR
jgi:hypothetical protein